MLRGIRNSIMIGLVLTAAYIATALAEIQPQVVYGIDDRLEVHEISDKKIQEQSRAVAALVYKIQLKPIEDKILLDTATYGDAMGLCSYEPFYNQPMAADCTAFLVGPDTLVSAGHCVSLKDCEHKSFVFDFRMKNDGTVDLNFNKENIYHCKKVLARKESDLDFAIIKLDRPVVGRTPLKLNLLKDASLGSSIYTIGYPSGVPMKVTMNGRVRTIMKEFYQVDIDTYHSNSGAPVFDSKSNEVIGILVRGEQDFVTDKANSCEMTYRCAEGECRGEDVSKITGLRPFFDLLKRKK